MKVKQGKHNPLSLDRLKELTELVDGYLRSKVAHYVNLDKINIYKYMVLDNLRYNVSDLTIYYCTGVFPKPPLVVDHIDGCRGNNHINNLRVVTRSENNLNRKIHRDLDKVGVRLTPKKKEIQEPLESFMKYTNYIYFDNDKKRFTFEIKKDGNRVRKRFRTLEEAIDFKRDFFKKYLNK